MKRLAIVHTHPIQYFAPLYRRLAERNDLTVYYCSRQGLDRAYDPGFGKAIRWDVPLLEGYRHKFLRNVSPRPSVDTFFGLVNPGIVREILSNRYDAVVIHGYATMTYWLAFFAARAKGSAVFFRGEALIRAKRRLRDRVKAPLLRYLFSRVDAFLVIGSRSRECYTRFGAPEEKLFFTPYSVDNDFFAGECAKRKAGSTALRRELGLRPELPVVLFCGKLVERKRPADVLEAFKGVSGRASLVFVGDGVLRAGLEQAAREIPNVAFAGFRNQSELPSFYAAADVFVLPSSEWEVSPLVVNEAMCCGLPVVLSDAIPSAPDFVRQGENGFIYKEGDVAELARILAGLVDDAGARSRLGSRSAEMIRGWSYSACADAFDEALKAAEARRG